MREEKQILNNDCRTIFQCFWNITEENKLHAMAMRYTG